VTKVDVGQFQRGGNLLEEVHLLLRAVHQGQRQRWRCDLERQARETGAGAHIYGAQRARQRQRRAILLSQQRQAHQRIQIVLNLHLFIAGDRSQVQSRVPRHQQVKVALELVDLRRRQGNAEFLAAGDQARHSRGVDFWRSCLHC
jgi:hypothetical protein